jgi:hypothetical protein
VSHTTIEKAPGACDTEGFDTNTSNSNSPTSGKPGKAIAPPIAPSPDKATILAALAVLFDPADVVELRAFTTNGRQRVDAGYFDADHWDEMADSAMCLSESGAAVYITLNPVDSQLLSRYSNRIQNFAKSTTTDKQVIRRRWLLVDFDPVRPSGTSATGAQLEAAKNKAREIHRYLAGIGWPAPMTALSGNGYHLLYAIDLPSDDTSTALVKAVLLALAERFDDAHTKVDRSVFNAARICKLYGTVANKGDHTASAPWRLSYLMDSPARVLVTVDQLAMLQTPAQAAAIVLAPSAGVARTAPTTLTSGSFNLEDFLARHSMVYTTDQHDGRERFKLAVCPFNPEHVNGEAAVFREPPGVLGFKCQHDSCAPYHWKEVRALLDGPQQGGVHSVAANGSKAMLIGQFGAQLCTPNDATLSEDEQRLRCAMAAIPAAARLDKHSAAQVIGMALRHESGGIDENLGKALCGEWDALTGGAALWVFDASDPHYSATKPLGLKSVFKLAHESGWIDTLPWPELQPLIQQATPQDYPLGALPDAVRCAVEEVAGFVKAPIPLIATSALAALSLAIQAHTDVQRAEKLEGPCSLFLLAIADSGERKSSCDGYFTKAIRDYEIKAQDAAKPLIKAYESEREAWDAHRTGIKDAIKLLAKSNKPITAQTQQLHALDATKPIPPRVPKLIYSDATPEALCYSLAKNWPSGGVISSEAGSVFGGHGMGAESVMRNLAALNQLWDGATLPIERRSSESFTVRGARLTMALQVQEATIRAFFANTKGLARGTGFLARFLVSWPESTQGTRHFTEAPANWPALTAFNERLTEILNLPAPIDDDGALTPAMLTLAQDAKAAWVAFHNAIESELPTGGELHEVRDVASKTADNAARLAALFHTFSGSIGPIDIKAMESAARVTRWHLYEARRFLGELAMPTELANAVHLEAWMLDYCKREQTEHVPTRVIQQRITPVSLRDKAVLSKAVSELAELGRARLVKDGKKLAVQIRPEVLAGDVSA